MKRFSICIDVLILVSLPLWSQQDSGNSMPSLGETFQDCAECPKMVVIPSGAFTMGSSRGEAHHEEDEEPLHRVRIDSRSRLWAGKAIHALDRSSVVVSTETGQVYPLKRRVKC